MSITFRLLCLSHEPALRTGEYATAGAAVDQIRDGVEGHAGCEFLIGRYFDDLVEVGCDLVEVGCPPTHLQPHDRVPCLPHPDTKWASSELLRLLALTRASGGPAVRAAAEAAEFQHWTLTRLHRLLTELTP